MTDGSVALARAYYRALDEHEYETLAELLAEEFVHDRPDTTLEGADRFVDFMRDERPQKDTSHRIVTTFTPRSDGDGGEGDGSDGGDGGDGDSGAATGDVAVRGRLLAGDGDVITGFVDVFTVSDGRLHRIDTYTN